MKTGVEIIAKARKGIRRGRDMKVEQIIGNVRHAEICSIIGNPHAGLEALAEAGALIAAEIDKVSGRGTWKSNPWVVVYEFELVK